MECFVMNYFCHFCGSVRCLALFYLAGGYFCAKGRSERNSVEQMKVKLCFVWCLNFILAINFTDH